MGLFSSLKKSFGGIASSLTGGLSGLISGDFGSAADALDPGNMFHESSSERRAAEQWQLEYDLNKKNYESQEKWNDLNYQAQQEAFQYQKDLNAMQMEREDTAVQRRVADLKAAGLSPTLAAGSSAQATPVHAGTAPQGQAPQQLPPSAIKAQAAMFKEQMERDYLQMAVGMMSNMADISRTKAETELIRAQKDRYIAETPIELRLKSLEQEFKDSTLESRVHQVVQNESLNDLKIINAGLNNVIAENTVALQALELVIKDNEGRIKAIEAKYADDKHRQQNELLKEEVKEKSIAIQLAEHVRDWEKNNDIPISAMSPVAKTFWPLGKGISGHVFGSENNPSERSSNGWLFGKSFEWWHKEPEWQKNAREKVFNFYNKVKQHVKTKGFLR